MRTKTLLLTAVISAAGIATSMAQVFSVNAVGYVTKTIPAKGFALISNPLTATDNTIQNLFKGAPDGLQVFKFDGAKFTTATYDSLAGTSGGFLPDAAAKLTVVPGEGVFVFNPTTAAVSFTFVGEVPQGTLNNILPKGLSIRSSMVPQAGDVKTLGLVGADGDQVYKYDSAAQKYITSTFDSLAGTNGDWTPTVPSLDVGDAFFLNKQAAGTWTRTFSVNQ